jgi:tetratricopeptide (TPR) repeat protein
MRAEPAAWLRIEAQKLWYALGNQELVHDYDLLGERELLGDRLPLGLPFGVLLGLGALGLWALTRGAPGERQLCVVLLGQVCAVLAANLLWFTSAQNRLPLVVPLALAAGPGALALRAALATRASLLAAISCTLLGAQAFVPRQARQQPSAAHYYNLANAEESLGQNAAALAHYARASERRPEEPMFWFRRAYLARRMQRFDVAGSALDHLERMPHLPAALRRALGEERAAVEARDTRGR